MIEHRTLSSSGSTRATAYTMSNKVVTANGKTHLVWLDRDHGVWAQTVDQESEGWDEAVLIGTGSDNHGGAALALDSTGKLHAMYGAHSEPLLYATSKEPNSTAEWDAQSGVGSRVATYPSLVFDSDDTLHLCYRGSLADESPQGVIYVRKPADGVWSEPVKLVESGGPRSYTHFENALHLAADDTLWLVYHIVRHGDREEGMAGVGFGAMRSSDRGKTWESASGDTLSLPAGPDAASTIQFDPTMDVRVGNICTDRRNAPYFTVNRREGAGETFLYRWSGGSWNTRPLLPAIEGLVGPSSTSSACALSITDGNLLYLAATVCRPGGEWSDISNEIVLLTSRDRGDTFRTHRISPGEPGVSNWLPTLERNTGPNKVGAPALLYTHGDKGEGCSPDDETEVRFVSLDALARQEEQRVRDAYDGSLMLAGLDFPDEIQDEIWSWVEGNRGNYRQLRETDVGYDIEPCLVFHPDGLKSSSQDSDRRPFAWGAREDSSNSDTDDSELAFQPVSALSELIRTKEISPVELTRLYLDRCQTYGEKLTCIVTLTDDLAMRQAKRAEAEIGAGNYRGPLHGIPWGAKDLLAAKGYPTTWGATPFREQIIDADAEVVQRLEAAGAVLVAKLSMGALAMGPHWFGGTTRNPWNIEEDSSGSSAGPGTATAAGLVGFSIGTETQGSIVGPSHKCSLAGLRPTYGRVPRTGGMVLSWTMDKIGPMCREVEDCAAVLAAIYGPDGKDASVADVPFEWTPDRNIADLRIGYLVEEFEALEGEDGALYEEVLKVLRSLGADPKPVKLPRFPYGAVGMVLTVEGAAMFDDITRSGEIDLTAEHDQSRWNKVFRVARSVPAVEYLRAQRIRRVLTREIEAWMGDWDVVLGAVFSGTNGSAMNLSGHPCLTVPSGFVDGMPRGINFLGGLYDEASILVAGRAYEQATEWHKRHPDMGKVLEEGEQ